MFRFALERPIIVTVSILIVCLFGILSFFSVPVQMIPDLDPRVISVFTRWPGATPQDVEKEILVEQEEYLRRLPALQRMTSEATMGRATIELEFPHGVDINRALLRVNNALSQVPSYPENVDEPNITSSSFSSNSFMYFSVYPLPGNPKNVDMPGMMDFIEDNVQIFLERVPGVDSVQVRGGQEKQMRLYVDPVKLAERDLSLLDVRNAVRGRNRDISGGDLDNGKRRYMLRTRGRFDSIESIENLVIAAKSDSFVRLRDVGYVESSLFETRTIVYSDGQRVINLSVKRQLGSNVIDIMNKMMLVVDELNQGVMKDNGMQIKLISEDVRYVQQSAKVVMQNLIIGAVLATLVLFLFLRSGSATLVGAIGIPVCAVTAFLGLLLTGRTMNVISMAGVAFAIGMTLDNSIVVLENIYKHMAEGKSRMQAAYDGVKEVWPAILASTLTTVFVFLPIIFIKEEAGQLYSDIAVAISASILMSMVVAITVIPVACSRFLKPNTRPPRQFSFYKLGQLSGQAIMLFVSWLLNGVIRRIVLISVVIFASWWVLENLTPRAEYLPEGEEKKIFASIFAPPGYNMNEMYDITMAVNNHYMPHVNKKPDSKDELPELDYFVVFATPNFVRFVVEVTDRKDLEKLTQMSQRYIETFPGVLGFVSKGSIFAGNSGGTRSINLDISGSDLVELFDVGLKAFIRSKQVFDNPRVKPSPSSLALGQPMIEIRPDWERAAELGIDADDLGYTIWAYSDGAFVDEYFQGDKKMDMFLYSTDGVIQSPQDLNHLMLYSNQGGMIPLSAIADVVDTVNTDGIRRVDGRRTITLSIIPPASVSLEEGVEIVQRDLIQYMKDKGTLTSGMSMNISGASDKLRSTQQALQGNFIVAVIISYLLMVAIFSHWGYPFLIMTSVPIGISGGIVGLWLVNKVGANLDQFNLQTIQQPFDMITMLGFLVLIGTVVNNPILLVERTMTNIRNRSMQLVEAIKEATASRLRPIMMSMITTIVGLSPLVLNPGEGTELYRGLGVIVLFGLFFSTVVTLTFIPAVLSLLLQLGQKSGWKPGKNEPVQLEQG